MVGSLEDLFAHVVLIEEVDSVIWEEKDDVHVFLLLAQSITKAMGRANPKISSSLFFPGTFLSAKLKGSASQLNKLV